MTDTGILERCDPRGGILTLAPNGLLAQSVTLVARTGAADRLDGFDGRAHENLVAHASRLGARPRGALWLVDALAEAALTGHGGGHFPVARKWRSALDAVGPVTVVANGAESEPLSAKDATLLRQQPHLVLDGLRCAMETIGARQGVVWLHESDHYTRVVLEEALTDRREAGEPGPDIEVRPGPNTYLAGESSSIARALEGGPALPTFRRRNGPTHGRGATLVHNVETLARVARASRECAFDDSRTRLECVAPDPLTSLLTVLTARARVVIEAPHNSTLGDVARAVSGPDAEAPTAVLLGGYGGTWASWATASEIEVHEPAMRAAGLTLGAGIVAPLPKGACGVAETARIVGYLAASSARQCGPCIFGLAALAESLAELAAGTAPRRRLRQVASTLRSVAGRGACHHPDGAVRLVGSALEVFDDDFARHARGHACLSPGDGWIPVPEIE